MSEIKLLTPDELADMFQLKRRTVMDTIARRPAVTRCQTNTPQRLAISTT